MARKKKLKTFTSTSEAPYDRHKYKCTLKDGREIILDDYEYVSGCHLSTEIGKMHGYYIMEHVGSGRQFKVKIPNFVLTADLKLN